MRVNMDSSIATDPRFKKLAKILGVDWKLAIGQCFLVWLVAYDNRKATLTAEMIDIAAEQDGFAKALCDATLCTKMPRGRYYLHGLSDRIKFLKGQVERGAKGGEESGKSRRAKGEANASVKQSGPRSSGEAYSLDLDLAQDQALAQDHVGDAAELSTAPVEAYSLADLMASEIGQRQPDHRSLHKAAWPSTRERWAQSFRLAHDRDGRDWGDMRELLWWSQRHDFWAANIQSGKKFREQFDTLKAQRLRDAKAKEEKGLTSAELGELADELEKAGY